MLARYRSTSRRGSSSFNRLSCQCLPVPDVVLAQLVVGLQQTGARLLSGLRPDAAKAQCQRELAVAGRQIDLAGERYISVFRAGVVPGHLEMLGEVLPSVGKSGEADRHLPPRRRAGEGQERSITRCANSWAGLCSRRPSRCFPAAIRQMRRQQRVQTIVGQRALQAARSGSFAGRRCGKDQRRLLSRSGNVPAVRCWSVCRPERRAQWHGFQICSVRFSSEK